MTIGERIKQRRIELNMSQEELAKKVGYKSRSSINKIELARSLPLSKVEKVAKALDVEPSYLMGWEKAPNKFGDYLIKDNYIELKNLNSELCKNITLTTYEIHLNEHKKNRIKKLLEKPIYEELLLSAEKCTDEQVGIAINMLKEFQNANIENNINME